MAWSLDSMWDGTPFGRGGGGDAAAAEAERQRQNAQASYERYAAVDEARKRSQFESDREYELKVKSAKQQAERIAIEKGQAKANAWYNKQMVKLSREKLEEERRQFDVTSSGYLGDGRPTLDRERFQDSSLQDWTKYAVELGSRPEDWVRYARYTSGVNNNLASIPGLSWTVGGQRGNTTSAGENRPGSLGNVLAAMGIASGGNWAAQAANQAATGGFTMTPDQKQIYETAREFSRAPQGAAPGWLESLDPGMKDMIRGAAEAQGESWSDIMARYQRSRWGGSGSSVAA